MTVTSFIRSLFVAFFLSLPLLAQNEPAASDVKQPEQANPASSLPVQYAALINEGDFKGLQQELLREIEKRNTPQTTPDSLLADPQYRQLIAMAELIRITSPEELAKFCRDIPYAKFFLQEFLGNTKWMELYLGAGRVPENTDGGLLVMAAIWKAHGRDTDFDDYLSLTSGLGALWATPGNGDELQLGIKLKNTSRNPVRRYEFFRKQQKTGKLHSGFMKLRPWEIRFVAGHIWDDESYEWIVRQVNIPPRRYNEAHSFVSYTGNNFFLDSIQTPFFHMPWRTEVCMAENMKLRGGVCGGLSTIAVLAANARGIPAYTVGQPGHCAFAVRVGRGNWKGGFGGPHGSCGEMAIFGGEMPTSAFLMEKVFADDTTADQAYRYSFHARAMEQLGKKDEAALSWQRALALTPVHPFFRNELHRLFKEKGTMKPEDWFRYAEQNIPHYKGNGFAAAAIFAEIEPLFITSVPEQQRLEWFKKIQQCIAGTKSARTVKCMPVIEQQYQHLETDQAKQQYLTDVFSVHLAEGDGAHFGQALDWAVSSLFGTPGEAIFAKAFEASAKAEGNSGNMDPKKMLEAYGKAILAAEQARSMPAFQALSDAAEPFSTIDPRKKTFSSKPLPGDLINPREALICLSSTCRWDKPWEHRAILMPCGGSSHTDQEGTPSLTVDLLREIDLSGIIITKGGKSVDKGRMKKLTVSTSVDGATWFPLEETKNMPDEWRIEAKSGTKAKWIKIEAHNDNPEFFQPRHVLIYKK